MDEGAVFVVLAVSGHHKMQFDHELFAKRGCIWTAQHRSFLVLALIICHFWLMYMFYCICLGIMIITTVKTNTLLAAYMFCEAHRHRPYQW